MSCSPRQTQYHVTSGGCADCYRCVDSSSSVCLSCRSRSFCQMCLSADKCLLYDLALSSGLLRRLALFLAPRWQLLLLILACLGSLPFIRHAFHRLWAPATADTPTNSRWRLAQHHWIPVSSFHPSTVHETLS